ncbi:hypothetical protein [Brevundimonas sp. NPDC046655]|uniref:hypothetical protein n=1 Tax=unclassified Brevundimonas TaxID=2622653 RepID=UPI00384F7251
MQVVDFVNGAKATRDALALSYATANSGSAVGYLLAEAALSEAQREKVVSALEQALTDAFYTMLLALDGAASLGATQQSYRLIGEDGKTVSEGDGSLEAAAFDAFESA